jgi:hypothetical protein
VHKTELLSLSILQFANGMQFGRDVGETAPLARLALALASFGARNYVC